MFGYLRLALRIWKVAIGASSVWYCHAPLHSFAVGQAECEPPISLQANCLHVQMEGGCKAEGDQRDIGNLERRAERRSDFEVHLYVGMNMNPPLASSFQRLGS